jgi:hypothetical protein
VLVVHEHVAVPGFAVFHVRMNLVYAAACCQYTRIRRRIEDTYESMGRSMIHDLIFCVAASSSISRMTSGLPIELPVRCTLAMMSGKTPIGGSGSSGAPTWMGTR